jgi:hypothetical protein
MACFMTRKCEHFVGGGKLLFRGDGSIIDEMFRYLKYAPDKNHKTILSI